MRNDLPTSLSRGPDGVHLDAQGITDLNRFFDGGGTAYGAAKQFGLSYGGSRARYDQYIVEKGILIEKPKLLLTTEERSILLAAMPIIQKILAG
jgi:hypothetical protein